MLSARRSLSTLKTWIMPSDYKPISCDLYDELELRSLRKLVIELQFLRGSETVTLTTTIDDLNTREGEEFATLGTGEIIRLDRLVMVDGQVFGGSCGI